ncbi:MAG: thioredoxin domain-containing protein [Gammaproteobacteria bacterium]
MLIVVALLAVMLSIYQWVELLHLRTASDTLLCSFNATFNCANVWNSALAHSVHQITRIPIVGWGLAWSLVVLVLSVWLLHQANKALPTADAVRALRLSTGVGVLMAVLLLAYSVSIKTFCPTCILFYLLVAVAAYLAFRRFTVAGKDWAQPALLSGGILLVTLALLLYPGLNTPREDLITAELAAPAAAEKTSPANTLTPLEEFLNSLPVGIQQATSDSLAMYRKSPTIEKAPDPRRITFGTAAAPVHLVEWTDIRCPHCKNLEAALTEIRKLSPPGSWSQATRHYPLDNQCNSKVTRASDGSSCLAAKLQICLIGSPDFARVRSTMFQQQAELTQDRIWDIASKDPGRRQELKDCVNSPATAAALQEDIDFAEQYQIEGTPLVVVNGRKAAALPAAILSLIMAGGNDHDPAFLVLPTPDPEILR